VLSAVTAPKSVLPSSNIHHRGFGMPEYCTGPGMIVRVTEVAVAGPPEVPSVVPDWS